MINGYQRSLRQGNGKGNRKRNTQTQLTWTLLKLRHLFIRDYIGEENDDGNKTELKKIVNSSARLKSYV